MSQAFSLTPRGLKTVNASNTVTVPMAGTTQLLELNVLDGVEKISFQVDNITQALDAFVVEGRVHQDASYFTIANAAADFSAPSGRVLAATGALVTLAAAASGRFDLDVSGLYSVKISASAAADSAVVTIYASGSAGMMNANVTLTAGDIEIGAVELKNATDDTRALIGVGTAIIEANNALAVKDPVSGVTTGAAVITDAAGTIQQYLRGLVKRWVDALGGGTGAASLRVNLATDVALPAGTNLMGKVGIDQTTPGTTNAVQANVVSGGIASGAVASGAFAAGAISNGANVVEGTTTDAAVITDANGTIHQYLRGLVKRWVDALGGGTGAASLRVNLATDVALPAGTNLMGKVGIDQTTPGTTNAVQANVASGGVVSGAIASGAIASGAIASGAIASGAVAAGAVAVGALVDGADLTQGTLGDAAVITDASGSISAKLRGLISLWVTHIGTALTPSAAVVTAQRPAVTQVVSTALEASHVLKASAGQLVQLTVFSSRTSSQYILLMNSTTVPGDGAVTLLYPPIPIGAASIIVIDFPAPLVASTGIAVCNSSTGSFTKTIGASDCAFYAQVN